MNNPTITDSPELTASLLPPPPPVTTIEVIYPSDRGEIGLRGNIAPLSWDSTFRETKREGDRRVFQLELPPRALLELKLVRNEDDWAAGRNFSVHAGDHLHIEPYFDRTGGRLLDAETLATEAGEMKFEVFLPPSYDEQPDKRYPVLYVQDGQALWTTSQDPFGIWNLDATLDQLYEIGAIEELIVVGIDTSERRVERLTHVADPRHGGGEAGAHLAAMVDALKTRIDASLRTKPGRADTALMGSSMGGLFSFYAAWTRPDVFGKAACLSSSFWWKDRHAIRMVQSGGCPVPRPVLYIDSGASVNAFEDDPGLRDGYHHTRSMFRALVNHCYTPGVDLHRLSFTGQSHDAPSWAARVAIPLQMLFPFDVKAPEVEGRTFNVA